MSAASTRRSFVARAAARVLLACAGAATLPVPAAEALPPGALLRQGEWRSDIGVYQPPAAWQSLAPKRWPMDGWGVLTIDAVAATLTLATLTPTAARQRLQPITAQVELARQPDVTPEQVKSPVAPPETEGERYLRVPGLAWQPGTLPLHRFRNGTVELSPELGHRFELSLAGQPFAFSLQNGLRTADGRAYGSGVQFRLEMQGQRHDYDLGGSGWEVRILALGDFDRDGRPDFLFSIGGANSSSEVLVLSSLAKPGRNVPTAVLTGTGC